MDAFDLAHRFVKRWEGGWSDHPADPGGLTRWGITLRALRAFGVDLNRDGRIDRADLAAMTEAEAAAFYRRHYWDAIQGDRLPPALALVLYDAAVNQGPGRAIRWLQAALGARVDGIIGPETRGRLAIHWPTHQREILRDVLAARALHYSGLAQLAVFGRGWFRRLAACALTAGWHIREE